MTIPNYSSINHEDWFSQGKADAWANRPKQAPENDPQAASFYDLGYDEGIIQRSPLRSATERLGQLSIG